MFLKRFSTRSAIGQVVKLTVSSDVYDSLLSACERSGRSKSFEVNVRVNDHLHKYPSTTWRGEHFNTTPITRKLTVRLDDTTNFLLVAAKNRSGWCKTYEMRDRLTDHLKKFPNFYCSETKIIGLTDTSNEEYK